MPKLIPVIRGPTEVKTWEWVTALAAAGFDFEIAHDPDGWAIVLPDAARDAAQAEIDAFEEVNRNWPPAQPPAPAMPRWIEASWSPLWVAGFLAAFYAWLGPANAGGAVVRAASMEAAAVRAGEWWRTVTALTVHADAGHLAGNLCSLLLLGHAACGLFGSGLAWVAILAAGVGGNAVEAWFFAGIRPSVGASTAGFGALGLLAAGRMVELARHGGLIGPLLRRTGLPLVAGLGMLAMLGSAPGSNATAHLLGMLCGAVIGALLAMTDRRKPPAWAERVLELACLAVVLIAWSRVLSANGRAL
jgi:membrane associated rhomboid family serine protease